MPSRWIAQRMSRFDSSGIRKVFDLAAKLKGPINLPTGQPHFDVPLPVRQALVTAVENRKNAYTQTQGIGELREKLLARLHAEFQGPERDLLVTSGTSGALVLLLMAVVDPGDEVILFDPYFVMYPALVAAIGGTPVYVDTYPDFRLDADRLAAAITPRTKAILLNSPANPTGHAAAADEIRAVAELAARHNILLVSDELYRLFTYDEPFVSPAQFNPDTLVIDGFSKSHAMTGWRVGFAHGPRDVIQEMVKLQQYTFVCAPQPAQWAALAALDVDMSGYIADYRRKRDLLADGLDARFQLARPGGAFYAFPQAPRGSGSQFVRECIDASLLVIPGEVFSRRDTHFRLSYAADDAVIHRGLEVLNRLARQ